MNTHHKNEKKEILPFSSSFFFPFFLNFILLLYATIAMLRAHKFSLSPL